VFVVDAQIMPAGTATAPVLSTATQAAVKAAQVAQAAQQVQQQAQSFKAAAQVHAQKAQEASSTVQSLQATAQAIAQTHTEIVQKIDKVREVAAQQLQMPQVRLEPGLWGVSARMLGCVASMYLQQPALCAPGLGLQSVQPLCGALTMQLGAMASTGAGHSAGGGGAAGRARGAQAPGPGSGPGSSSS
jgi:hypothetical protein